MLFSQYAFNQKQKMSLGAKISLAIWIIVSLSLLFAFTFTLFLIAVLAGIVILVLRMFSRKSTPTTIPNNPEIYIDISQLQNSDRKKNNDIIDI